MTRLAALRGPIRRRLRRWPLGAVAVSGPSMAPALVPGDLLIVRWGGRVRPGRVVLARRPGQPGLLVIKRAVRRGPAGWELAGDNPYGSEDSRQFGPVPAADVVAAVLWRYWPPSRFGPLPARRLS